MIRDLAADGDHASIGLGRDDMARQHRAVRLELSELRAMIDGRRATQRTDAFRRMLAVLVARLRERLVVHFELEEERGGGEGEGVTHAEILAEGAGLALQLRAANAPPDVVARTLGWLAALQAHEEAEDGRAGA